MGQTSEPRMDELKRLLRRLDGLDGSVAKKVPETALEQRGYVGALRGAPVPGDEDYVPAGALAAAGEVKRSSNSAVYVAAVTAAIISTVTVYLMMTWQEGPDKRGAGPLPSSDQILPSKLDPHQSATGAPGATPIQPSEKADGLLLRAEELLEKGEVEAARVLLRQAAELGSGTAALKLGRTYDPTQTKTASYADSQANSALAKAWYERALALGTQEAASYMSSR